MSSDAVITFPLLGEGFSLSFKPYFTLFGWTFHWYGIIIAFGFLLAEMCIRDSFQTVHSVAATRW